MVRRRTRTPTRMCVACGRRAPQGELVRLAVDGREVKLDPFRSLPGRGAYLCRDVQCFRRLAADSRRQRIFRKRLGQGAWAGVLQSEPADNGRKGNSRRY
jgi:predicted RNA-binding protein YlxR (DUF448 family)